MPYSSPRDPYSYPGGHFDQARFERLYSGNVPPLQSLADDAVQGYQGRQGPVMASNKGTYQTPITKFTKKLAPVHQKGVHPPMDLYDFKNANYDEDKLPGATSLFLSLNPWILS